MTPTVGWIVLTVYALLLGGGGAMGYVKAGSKPSLIAGLASAAVALLALFLSFLTVFGFYLGALLAVAMLVVFAIRLSKTRKFMPSGLLLGVSLVVLILMVLTIQSVRPV